MLDIFELIFMTVVLVGMVALLFVLILDLIQIYFMMYRHSKMIWDLIKRKIEIELEQKDYEDSGN